MYSPFASFIVLDSSAQTLSHVFVALTPQPYWLRINVDMRLRALVVVVGVAEERMPSMTAIDTDSSSERTS